MFTVTSETLLAGLCDPHNQTLWQGYVDRYRPVLVGWFHSLGVPAADAEDLAQETLVAFAGAFRAGRYQREVGRLRSWLFGFARNHARSFRRQRGRDRAHAAPQPATGFFDQIADQDDRLEELWDQQWRDAVLRQCLDVVRKEVEPTTYEAFVRFARDGQSAREVAESLGLTENAVFGCKRRVLQRIRELLPEIGEAF